MLGKQWLNRYASTDLRGTAIERSQNRQRKLDGVVAWYFDHVLESLPLMLQAALLLLGCALSRYLWEVNITVASVILGFTSSSFLFYIFIVTASAASESCPYQTPGSHALRYLLPKVLRINSSATSAVILAANLVIARGFRRSEITKVIGEGVTRHHPWWSRNKITPFLKDMALEVPRALAIDIYRFGRAMTRLLVALPIGASRLVPTAVVPLVSLARRVRDRLRGPSPTLERGLDWETTALDLRCILWMLQTSLDRAVHLSTSKHLATMMTLVDFDPILVVNCLNTFVGCVNVTNHKVAIVQQFEELATVSALCLFNTISHLQVTDPTSDVLEDVRLQYLTVFPVRVDFHGHQFCHTMNAVHCLFVQRRERWSFQWSDYKPSTHEDIPFARGMVKAAQAEYQKPPHGKVPRWILRFALHCLSLDPPPPASIVADCLSIIAIDLVCDLTVVGVMAPDERCVCISRTNVILTLN